MFDDDFRMPWWGPLFWAALVAGSVGVWWLAALGLGRVTGWW